MYLVIPKCGCTFVKNMLWMIDHSGEAHVNPRRVHDDDTAFLRATAHGKTDAEIRQSEFAFTVVRDPVERFISLYFDKVIGNGHRKFVPLRAVLAADHRLNISAATAQEHRENCKILIGWIKRNLKGKSELKPDAHWTPILWRRDMMTHFDLKLLPLGGLDRRLKVLLGGYVPRIDEIVGSSERYQSARLVARRDLLDPELREMILATYHGDTKLTSSVWDYWTEHKPQCAAEIPRAGQFL